MSGGDAPTSARQPHNRLRIDLVRSGLRTERAWQGLAIAVVVGFVLRLVWVLVATREPQGYHDPIFYQHLATNLAEGYGYVGESGLPTAYYPPGYPFLLGVVYTVVLHTPLPDDLPMAGALLNLVLGTATIAVVGVLGRRLFGPWVGALAAAGVALFPNLIMHTSLLLSETTFNFFFTLTLVVLFWNPWRIHPPGRNRIVAVGMLAGFCVLIRPVALPALIAFTLGLWLVTGPRKIAIERIGLLVLGAAALILPWTARNAVAMDAFVPISTNTGDNLCIGNHEGATGGFALPDSCFEGLPDFPQDGGDVERNREATARAVEWMAANPLEQVSLVWWRNYYTFVHDHDALEASTSYGADPWLTEQHYSVLATASDAYFFGMVGLAAVGVVVMIGHGRLRRSTYLFTMIAVITATWWTFGDVRFHVPLNPLLTVPAALVLVSVPMLRHRFTPSAADEVSGPERSTSPDPG